MLYPKFLICTLSCNWLFFFFFFWGDDSEGCSTIEKKKKNSFHEGCIVVWTKGIIEVGFDVVGNSRAWACRKHMKALFLTVVLTAALFIAALKYWHIWSTEMSEFYSWERNLNGDSVDMGAWGHRSPCAKKHCGVIVCVSLKPLHQYWELRA